MKKIAVLLAEGFEEIETITPIDILRRAGFDVDLVSIGQKIVKGSHQISIESTKGWENMEAYDAVFIPGGQPGATNLAQDERVLELLKSYHLAHKVIAAICAGPTVLQAAGIIQGRKVTSYPMANVEERFKGTIYLNENVVLDGNILTSRGVGTALEFAFVLVDLLGSDSTDLKRSTLYQIKH